MRVLRRNTLPPSPQQRALRGRGHNVSGARGERERRRQVLWRRQRMVWKVRQQHVAKCCGAGDTQHEQAGSMHDLKQALVLEALVLVKQALVLV